MDRAWIPYCGAAPLPGEWLARWNFDPWVLAALAAVAIWALRQEGVRWPFWAGLAYLALLFVSPLCALSSALFSVRVIHHVVLTAVAAPLIAEGLGRISLRGAAVGWTAASAVLFWLWHAPAPYALALSSDLAYWIMQAALFGGALGFWASLRRVQPPFAIALLLAMMVQMGLLGALITFAGAPLYAPHWLTTQPWGLTPLQDQQLAGIIMWAPASALYLAAALRLGWTMLAPPRAAA